MAKLIFILITLLYSAFPQKKDPEEILNEVKRNFDRIADYKVNVEIKVDVDFIKVPDMQAKLYFKQPDKMQLDSEGFAMLPRSGMNFSPSAFLSGEHTSFYVKEDVLDGINTTVIKIIPLEDKGEVVLSTLWIDTDKDRIKKIETTTKTQGTYSIMLEYSSGINYPLPSRMTFSFNIEKMNLPKGMSGDLNSSSNEENREKTTTGKVVVNYSGYSINEGIPDSVFEEKGKK